MRAHVMQSSSGKMCSVFIVPEVTRSEAHAFCKTISSLKETGFSG